MHDHNFVAALGSIQYEDHNIDLFRSQLLKWISFFTWEGQWIFQIEAEYSFLLTSRSP